MTTTEFKQAILQGIPNYLPKVKPLDSKVNHAPVRKNVLSVKEEKKKKEGFGSKGFGSKGFGEKD